MEASPFLSLDIYWLDFDVNLSMDFDGKGQLWRSSLLVSTLAHVLAMPIKHRKTTSQKRQKRRGINMNKINTSFYYSLHVRKI